MHTACIQMCCGTDIAKNLKDAEALIRAAHAEEAAFIATPENTLLMQENRAHLFTAITSEDRSEALSFFAALAKELGIHLLIGSMAMKVADDKAANRSFLFGPEGQLVARYDKIHLFDVDINAQERWKESSYIEAGTKPVLAPIADFTLGLSICYDLRFAALYKHYAHAGANLISVPSAFTAVTGKAHWETLLKARAIETSSYVIAPAQGGHHGNGRVTWGHSMIVDPWGRVIATLDHDGPGFCIADLDMDVITRVRAQIPAWNQQTQLP